MKDIIFPKEISFDPVVTEKPNVDSNDFIPSKTFTTAKPGYVFTVGDKGQGYYKDNFYDVN